jgi:hypothetical protein
LSNTFQREKTASAGTAINSGHCLQLTAENKMLDPDKPKITRTSVEARGAVVGHNVRWVLLWGTLAAAAMMAVLYFMLLHSHPPA